MTDLLSVVVAAAIGVVVGAVALAIVTGILVPIIGQVGEWVGDFLDDRRRARERAAREARELQRQREVLEQLEAEVAAAQPRTPGSLVDEARVLVAGIAVGQAGRITLTQSHLMVIDHGPEWQALEALVTERGRQQGLVLTVENDVLHGSVTYSWRPRRAAER